MTHTGGMTQLQQIRQEIERLKGICTAQIKANPGQTFPFVMEMTGYDKLLSFLDTLSEEPDKSLEEEIDRFEDWMETYNQSDYPTSFTTRDIARHFAEWQKQQMLKDAVEGRVFMSFAPGHNQMVMADVDLPTNTKVRIIVLKEKEK